MGGTISKTSHVSHYSDDVIVHVPVVTSELSLSSCVVAQNTGRAVSRFITFIGYSIDC